MANLRILPLISSATEIVHALGLGSYQVGRSHECDYPPEVLDLPVCTKPAFSVSGSSAEIDQLVKDRLASAASIYEVDSDLIRQLNPTHIITQTQCKVCAVSLEDVDRALQEEIGIEACIVPLEPYALSDLWADIRRVANACGQDGAGEQLVSSLEARIEEIRAKAHTSRKRPCVAALEWLDPLMAAGNWIPELIELAAGRNLFGVAGEHSPWMTWEQLVASDPDVIIALPCGFDLARTEAEIDCLVQRPSWSQLKAVHDREVYVCDGNQYMNRPGPRLVDSLQIFAEILHPKLFAPAFEHAGWKRWNDA